MHSAQFTCPILLTSNASFSGIKAYRGIVSMNGPDVVYDIVARLRPFVLSRKLFEALAIRLHLHKSISSFHGASIDFPSFPFFSAYFSRRCNKERQITRLRETLHETIDEIRRVRLKGERSMWFDKYAFKITFLFHGKGNCVFSEIRETMGKVRLRDYHFYPLGWRIVIIIVQNFTVKLYTYS